MIVRDSAGDDHPVPIYPGMSAARLREELSRRGIAEVQEAAILCADDELDLVRELLAMEFSTARIDPPERVVEPTEGQYIRGEYRVSAKYFQALAKIAFHYYLVHNRRGYRGSEPMFEPIRRFICSGGDPDAFFHAAGRTLISPIGQLLNGNYETTVQWSHWLGAVEDEGSAVVHLQFYVGPDNVPEPTFVTLGRFEGGIIVPGAAWGHVFVYGDAETGRYSGRVHVADMTRFRPSRSRPVKPKPR